MAFLDNSGDIILDAVLTDTGRMRLSKGDGTFKIAKYAFADDEIDYQKYNKDHASGSAYYDLDILQTPILEAFTNNMSTMKNKLLSIPRTNLLYLPILKLREYHVVQRRNSNTLQANGKFVVAVDERTARETVVGVGDAGLMPNSTDLAGVMDGFNPIATTDNNVYCEVLQGLDTTEIDPSHTLSGDLTETQYIIEIDNRLGTIVSSGIRGSKVRGIPAAVSFIDDDNVASYYLSLGTDPDFIFNFTDTKKTNQPTRDMRGPRGTTCDFAIAASTELQTSDFLFNRLGTTGASWTPKNAEGTNLTAATVSYIDSTIRVTGVTTGYRIDIPFRFIKRTA